MELQNTVTDTAKVVWTDDAGICSCLEMAPGHITDLCNSVSQFCTILLPLTS